MILHSFQELKSLPDPLVIAAGVFDGVHLAHQTLIHRALEDARYVSTSASCVVLTFDPHPAQILRPAHAPRLLTSTPHKIRLLQELGIKDILILPFDAKLAALPAAQFIQLLIQNAPSLCEICVGHNWSFGQGRKGNVDLLRELGAQLGFRVTEIGMIEMDGKPISSTRIREAIQAGDLTSAAKYLGRAYTILGTVVPGDSRGRSIGFPTANLATHNELFPPNGVYAVHVLVDRDIYPGVANIGVRPTVSSSLQRILEVHLLDYSENLYGRELEVRFEAYLRPENKFENIRALQTQIQADIRRARASFRLRQFPLEAID